MNRCLASHSPDWDAFDSSELDVGDIGTVTCTDCGRELAATYNGDVGWGTWTVPPLLGTWLSLALGLVTASVVGVLVLGMVGVVP